MVDTIPACAYVLRNKATSTVLHHNGGSSNIDKPTSIATTTAAEQDEERHRERQIWWIEADPGYEDINNCDEKTAKEGAIYRITTIATAKSLDVKLARSDNGTPAVTYKSHGAPWQLWRFKKLPQSTDDREFYNIVSVHTGKALDIHRNNECYTWQLDVKSERQAWELLRPVVSVPTGWLRLQNAASGRVLSHTYPSMPVISTSTPTSNSSIYRECWATQWAFINASFVDYWRAGNKSYVIKNRLTGGHLRCQPSKFAQRGKESGSINAWESRYESPEDELWRFELDVESNWKIIHQKSGFLLEEATVPLLDGNEVVCATKTGDKRKSWVFVPIKDIDRTAGLSSPPPAYNASTGGSAAS